MNRGWRAARKRVYRVGMKRTFVGAAALALGLLAGCDASAPPAEIQALDASGKDYPTDFALTDHHGKPRRLSEFRGKVVALFFGFTQCPEVCPTTLAEFAQVYRALGPDADRVQVIFVTLDPERDTRELLAQFVPAFDARFLALSGTPEQTRQVADAYDVTYRKVAGRTPGFYTIDHTSYIFLFDASGRLRLKMPHGQPAPAIERLIREIQE